MKWLDRIFGRDAYVKDLEIKSLRKDLNNLRAVLAGNKPGVWASDHYMEALKYKGWVYSAVNALCMQVQQSELQTKMEPSSEEYQYIEKPNMWQSRRDFEFVRCLNLHLTGTCIVWETNTEFGRMRIPIPTALVTATRLGYFRFSMTSVANIYWNEVSNGLYDFISEKLPYEECSIFRFHHPTNLGDGFSPVSAGSYWLDTADQIDISRFNCNANAVRRGLIVTESSISECSKDDRERIRAELYAEYSGSEYGGKNIFLPKGLEAKVWQANPDELDHGRSFEQMRDATFALFGVPPIAAGVLTAGSHSAFYSAMLQLTELKTQPYLDWIGAEDYREIKKFYNNVKEFRYKARRVDDPEIKKLEQQMLLDVIKLKMESGCYTRDEIRAMFKDKPLDPETVSIGLSKFGKITSVTGQGAVEVGQRLVDTTGTGSTVEEAIADENEDRTEENKKKKGDKTDSGLDNPAKIGYNGVKK